MKRIWKLIIDIWNKYREQIMYLFFGVVTTLVNYVVYFALTHFDVSTGLASIIAWAASVLVAYITNRLWVFESKSTGKAAVREFLSFVGCRVGTGVMDAAIMVAAVDWLGPKFIAPGNMRLWESIVKILSNVLVVVLNYVFSKIMIFKKDRD